MRRLIAAILCFFISSAMVHAAPPCIHSSTVSQEGGASAPGQHEADDLRQDIQRMKVLVQQMEMNLAFVDTTQSPLKHQFQLEIDMWKTVISDMEKKLNSSKNR